MSEKEQAPPFETGESQMLQNLTNQHLVAKILGREDLARNTRIRTDPFTWASFECLKYAYMTRVQRIAFIRSLDAQDIIKEPNDDIGTLEIVFNLAYKNAAVSEQGAGRTEFTAAAMNQIQVNADQERRRHLFSL